MKRFKVTEDELYPFYEIKEHKDGNLELSSMDHIFIENSYKNFHKAQEIIKNKIEFESEKCKNMTIEKQNNCKHDWELTCKTRLNQNKKITEYSEYKCKCGLTKTEYA